MVPGGTALTMDVKGQAGQWIPRSPGEVRSQVSNKLTPLFDVYDVSISADLSDLINTGGGYFNWPFTSVVQLRTRSAYADSQDVASIVANAFYSASGTVPSVDVRGYGPQATPDIIKQAPSLVTVGTVMILGAALFLAWPYIPKGR